MPGGAEQGGTGAQGAEEEATAACRQRRRRGRRRLIGERKGEGRLAKDTLPLAAC
jgi:hypothetical protein